MKITAGSGSTCSREKTTAGGVGRTQQGRPRIRHAYGKALRTWKTCVGSEWCRLALRLDRDGHQDRKMTWDPDATQSQMAVSGCPRNCAEATIKDFGVVAIDRGWNSTSVAMAA